MLNNLDFYDDPDHFMILAIIAKEDQEGVDSDMEEIAQVVRFFKSEVEYIIHDLLSSGLILKGKTISTDISSLIQTTKTEEAKEIEDFTATELGLGILSTKKRELEQKWMQIKQIHNSRDKDHLYSSVYAIREWVPFMLYSRVIDTIDLQSMIHSIGIDISKLQVSDLNNTLADLGIDPQLLAAGLVLASPVAGMLAVIAYFLANFCLATLEKVTGEKHHPLMRRER
ncbi:MAG TPA: hypothetical protein VEL11_18340 [Candidatus Bathyarchaeia archaeon]|nr:hypothetical protein [Candidatus Bathyarchaeia archaeon]